MSTITSLPTTPMSVLPTPPFTPAGPLPHQAHLLDSLIVHYQRERMWVKQTQDMISVARLQLQRGSHAQPTDATVGGKDPLWQRRKTRRKLHLNDIAHSKLSKRLLNHDAYGTKILDLFATLLDARIESCKRIETLVVQSAHARRHIR